MLITLYQLRHGRFVPIKEYYNWRVQLADELDEGPVHGKGAKGNTTQIPCPGCGKTLPRAKIRYDHLCDGELMDYKVNNMRYLYNRRWTPSKGEPRPEGCPVPTPSEIRSMYNADINARVRAQRMGEKIPEDLDDAEIYDYTTSTTATSQPAVR